MSSQSLSYLAISWGNGPMFFKRLAQSPPSTYSITMQRCFLLSKLQYMETTKGLSVKVRMSLSANTWSIYKETTLTLLSIRNMCQVT